MKRYVLPVVALVVVCILVAGCIEQRSESGGGTPVAEVAVEVNAPASAFDIPYEPANVKAAVAPYSVKPGLKNVVNLAAFGKFAPSQTALLVKNAFAAGPTDEQQLFFIYEQNDYKNIPSFITTDSVLQVYHIFYDFTLRKVEQEKLYGVLESLTGGMLDQAGQVTEQMSQPEWKKAAQANEVYFAVPYSLLGKQAKLPTPEQQDILKKELALVNKAEGRTRSALFPWDIDYSQFIPRGHYTRTDLFKRYFKAMMWYGYMPFPVQMPDKQPDLPRIRQSVLITWMLFNAKIGDKAAIEAWQRIYEPTAFYVGSSDDLTPYQYKAVVDKVYGPNATLAQLQDESKLAEVYAELKKLAGPRIDVKLVKSPQGKSFKFMGQRYIPDSEMMQRLVTYPERVFPKGLDVMAVLGSKRAADILDNVYKEPAKWAEYLPNRNKLLAEFDAVPLKTWQSNLYWGWLWTLDSLLEPFGVGYPSFMRNQAWVDKDLNTALGSWAELRHDTILYAKQSGVECGGADEDLAIPKGYVEPNVEFYNRLLWLTQASKTGLTKRGLLSEAMSQKFSDFEDLLTFLKNISIKELTNQKITKAEYEQIRLYGANLEMLTLSVIQEGISNWYEITSETDRDMAVIADVHTGVSECLEEGVGHANEMYVIVLIEGKLYLTRGAIFSYYEFTHPASDRLTDEKWQTMLKGKKAPPPPEWVKSFMRGVKREVPTPRKVRTTGC